MLSVISIWQIIMLLFASVLWQCYVLEKKIIKIIILLIFHWSDWLDQISWNVLASRYYHCKAKLNVWDCFCVHVSVCVSLCDDCCQQSECRHQLSSDRERHFTPLSHTSALEQPRGIHTHRWAQTDTHIQAGMHTHTLSLLYLQTHTHTRARVRAYTRNP